MRPPRFLPRDKEADAVHHLGRHVIPTALSTTGSARLARDLAPRHVKTEVMRFIKIFKIILFNDTLSTGALKPLALKERP